MAIARKARVLRGREAFETVLTRGARVTTRNFVARAGANVRGHARLGIIAGRKAAARAVDRNRAKRLIREMFRGAPGLDGCDVTIQLRGDLRKEPSAAVRGELALLLERVARRVATDRADR